MNELNVVNEQEVLGKEFRIYGNLESPLFLAKDVASWIEHTNLTVMINSVDDDEKVISRTKDCLGRYNTATFLTENGLYEVLMLSRKPIAKSFKKEVKKVLHSLRVNGGYISGQENLSEDELLAKALVVAQQVIARKDAILLEQKPKVEFYDAVTSSSTTFDMKDVAKILGKKNFGRNNLFEFLRDKGVLDIRNLPYQRYVNAGYFKIVETSSEDRYGNIHVNVKTVVFQKGIDFIRKLVKEA